MSRQRIFSTKSSIESMGIQKQLESQNISFEVIDKTDSSYASLLGSIEIFVDDQDQEEAEKLIEAYFQD
mgnify:FL=1